MVVMLCEEDSGTNPGSAGQIRCFAPPLVLFTPATEAISLLPAAAFYDLGCVSRFKPPFMMCGGGGLFCLGEQEGCCE